MVTKTFNNKMHILTFTCQQTQDTYLYFASMCYASLTALAQHSPVQHTYVYYYHAYILYTYICHGISKFCVQYMTYFPRHACSHNF